MKKIWVKVLVIFLTVILLLLIGGYFGRQGLVKARYGDLTSFDYYTGGGVAGYFEHYTIAADGDGYLLTAKVHGSDELEVSCPVDSSVADHVLGIIASENLYLYNGIDSSQEGLYDGMGEALAMNCTGGSLSYHYYGSSTYRNKVLADYLLQLTRESAE